MKKSIIFYLLFVLLAGNYVLYIYFQNTEVKPKIEKNELADTCATKKKEYEELYALGNFWKASLAIRQCAIQLKNDEYQKLADSAEVKARIIDINDKSKSSLSRLQEIEILEKYYPSEAKQFTSLKTTLIAENAKISAIANKAIKAQKKQEGVSIGMSKQDVLDSSWGKPERVNTTTNAYGVREQWVYRGGNYLYFKDGVLESISN
jgi:hypothetical protein